MTDDEELLRATLRVYEERAPEGHGFADAAVARARSQRRKRAATVGGVLSAVLLVGIGWAVEQSAGSPSGDVASAGDPPGQVVGEELGLEPVAWPPPAACDYFAAYAPNEGYCLDGVSEDTADLVILTQRINGWEMTEDRERYIRASIELYETGEGDPSMDPAEVARLEQILDESISGRGVLNAPQDLSQFEGLTGKELGDALGLVPMTSGLPIILCDYGISMGKVDGHEWSYCIEGLATDRDGVDAFATQITGRNLLRSVAPDVVGLAEADAVAALEQSGFEVDVDRGYSPEPEGTVVFQTPRAGDKALQAWGAQITVSKGEEPPQPPGPTAVVPDVVGMTKDDALAAMEAAGFRVSVISWIPSDGQRGIVLSQDPEAGVEFEQGDGIRLRVTQ